MTFPESLALLWTILQGSLREAFILDLNQPEAIAVLLAALGFILFGRFFRWKLRWQFRTPRGMPAVVIISLLALVARVALLTINPVPQPIVHDEFSFLLQADTFMHGRLANPTPPLWQHFETMHVFFEPTYSSMYFPMQGFILMIGMVLGHAWVGSLLSVAAMCGAVVWMLQAWMPARWAFIGGLLAILRTDLFSYWVDGYWGGAHAAFAGALVLGAWPRLARAKTGRRRTAHAVALGIGLVVLALGRPYEGFLLAVPVAIAMWFGYGKPARDIRVFVPVALTLAAGAAFLGYFCWRVTGSPFVTPYALNRATYGWPQTLLFLPPPRPPEFLNREMSNHYIWELNLHRQTGAWWMLLKLTLVKINLLWSFYFGPSLSLALLMLPWIWRDHRFRALLAPCGVLAGGLLFSQSVTPHYAGPAASGFFAIAIQGFRHLRLARLPRFAVGVPLARAIPVALTLAVVWRMLPQFPPASVLETPFSWCCVRRADFDRAFFLHELTERPGKHLVFVDYSQNHSSHKEWVYNEADIPQARIVWARKMTPALDLELSRYYHDRMVWTMLPDETPPRLEARFP